MLQKKICMLGSFAVGKTSLVSRFVKSIFSEKYFATVGVKIDKKIVELENETVNLVIWDINGKDEVNDIKLSYLRGASGYFLIADGTRPKTIDIAFQVHKAAQNHIGSVPFILLLNKYDLKDKWAIPDEKLTELNNLGVEIFYTSAKTGDNVEDAFFKLAKKIIA